MIPVQRLDQLAQEDLSTILLRGKTRADQDAVNVAPILGRVLQDGDTSLKIFTRQFDKVEVDQLRVPSHTVAEARDLLDPDIRMALEVAWTRILDFHREICPTDVTPKGDPPRGIRYLPVDRAGLYAPGGRAVYPSSVLMNAAPAVAAGVESICLVSPPQPNGEVHPTILAAAAIAGIEEIYRVGGAQAIGALAYGTDTIAPVDVIAGPGNAWVAAAKEYVQKQVRIDLIAGPSEIGILWDGEQHIDWIAADCLAQLEHDPDASALVVTWNESGATTLAEEIENRIESQPREKIIRPAAENNAWILIAGTPAEATEWMNSYAPEHLTIVTDDPERDFRQIRSAGSVFLGPYSPVAVGDYCTGPNHVLPTMGHAQRSGGLTPMHFLKSMTWQQLSQEDLQGLGPVACILADAEGLNAHAESIRVRLEEYDVS